MAPKVSPIKPQALEDRSPGELLREARVAHRLSQRVLAIRAGTTQSAIARIEADRISPTIKTLVGIFQVMQEDFIFGTRPRDTGVDLNVNRKKLELSATERIEQGVRSARDQRRSAKGE
jgi:transcriptional regulator with XRE-family HTH domain